LELRFHDGRLLRQTDGALSVNARFGDLRLLLDASSLVRPAKQSLLPLAYYRDDELQSFVAQTELCRSHGVDPGPAVLRRADAVDVVRALRRAGALHPALAMAVVVLLLARPLPAGSATTWIAFGAILAGLVLQIALEARATKSADLPGLWVALLPAATTVAT